MEFQLENPLPTDTTDPSSLFFVESDHMPSEKYAGSLRFGDFDVAVRQETIGLISQLCSGLDRLVSYLSVNYLDRFLSSQKLPVPDLLVHLLSLFARSEGSKSQNLSMVDFIQQTKPWALRLIAMSCVSLATKMQGVNLSRSDLQGNGVLIFDSGTLQRMEVLILGALKWRMRSITPFSFVPFFGSLFQLKDLPLRQALKGRATEIIFRAQTDINLLGFKPSIVAASALLRASNELFPVQFSSFRDAICGCSYVNKDHLDRCYGKMQQVAFERYESAHDSVSRSDTPSNVLDQQFRSTSDSERTGSTSGRALKRRKTSGSASSVLT